MKLASVVCSVLRASSILIDEVSKHTPVSELLGHSGHRSRHSILNEFNLPVLSVIVEYVCYEAALILLRPAECKFLGTSVLLATVVDSHLVALIQISTLVDEIIY